MLIYGLDAGQKESAIVAWNGNEVIAHQFSPNEDILSLCESGEHADGTKLRYYGWNQ